MSMVRILNNFRRYPILELPNEDKEKEYVSILAATVIWPRLNSPKLIQFHKFRGSHPIYTTLSNNLLEERLVKIGSNIEVMSSCDEFGYVIGGDKLYAIRLEEPKGVAKIIFEDIERQESSINKMSVLKQLVQTPYRERSIRYLF